MDKTEIEKACMAMLFKSGFSKEQCASIVACIITVFEYFEKEYNTNKQIHESILHKLIESYANNG